MGWRKDEAWKGHCVDMAKDTQQTENGKSHWAAVRGPISVVTATLRNIGWRPHTPATWTAPNGRTWRLKGIRANREVDIEEDLMAALIQSIENQFWEKAAKRHELDLRPR